MANIAAPIEQPSSTLFAILPSQPVGMARLAAQATHADDGHLIEFRSMKARSLLNRSVSKRQLSLEWSINPYRGCEFGCKYCYARYTHEFLEPKKVEEIPVGRYEGAEQPWAKAFEREIYLKENAAWLLEQELKKIDPAQEIALGTATDPYQPIERRVGITRGILEVFSRHRGYKLGMITKSNLITRDIDLLQRIAEHNTLVVHVTITTTDTELARKLEPRAPRPDRRFAAVKKLREAGIRTGIFCSPLLPGINDAEAAVTAVAKAAAEAGASFMAAQPLFLKSCSRPTWLSFVREHFPALLDEYDARFARADFADAAYRRQMAAMLGRVCRKYGLSERSTDALLTRDVGKVGLLPASAGSSLRKPPRAARGSETSGAQIPLFA